MKTVAMHKMFIEKNPEKRMERTLWVSNKRLKKIEKGIKNQEYNFYNQMRLEILDSTDTHAQISIKPNRYLDDGSVYIACDCGFKGRTEIHYIYGEDKNVMTKEYVAMCPTCYRTNFDIEAPYQEMKLLYTRFYKEPKNYSLSIGFHSYKATDTREGDPCIVSFPTKLRLTYCLKTRRLYLIRNKGIQNVTYGSFSYLMSYFFEYLAENKEAVQTFCQFMMACYRHAGIQPKKRQEIIRKMKKEPHRIIDKSDASYARCYFPLLAFPQLQAIDSKYFLMSIATAPKRIKKAISQAKMNKISVYAHLAGFSSKRLFKIYDEKEFGWMLIDILKPIFRNKEYLLDILTEVKNSSGGGYHMFEESVQKKKEWLPLFRFIKKKYRDELAFRNALIELLRSHYCQGHMDSCVRTLKDIRKMEVDLLSILPSERLPKRTSLIALHNAYVKEVNKNEEAFQLYSANEYANVYTYTKKEKSLEWQKENCQIRLVTSPIELFQIGKQLNNCVRNYTSEVLNKEIYVVILEEDGLPHVCMEVRRKGKGWELAQANSYKNDPMFMGHAKIVDQWMKQHNIPNEIGILNKTVANKYTILPVKDLDKQTSHPFGNQTVANRYRELQIPAVVPAREQEQILLRDAVITDADLPF